MYQTFSFYSTILNNFQFFFSDPISSYLFYIFGISMQKWVYMNFFRKFCCWLIGYVSNYLTLNMYDLWSQNCQKFKCIFKNLYFKQICAHLITKLMLNLNSIWTSDQEEYYLNFVGLISTVNYPRKQIRWNSIQLHSLYKIK